MGGGASCLKFVCVFNPEVRACLVRSRHVPSFMSPVADRDPRSASSVFAQARHVPAATAVRAKRGRGVDDEELPCAMAATPSSSSVAWASRASMTARAASAALTTHTSRRPRLAAAQTRRSASVAFPSSISTLDVLHSSAAIPLLAPVAVPQSPVVDAVASLGTIQSGPRSSAVEIATALAVPEDDDSVLDIHTSVLGLYNAWSSSASTPFGLAADVDDEDEHLHHAFGCF